MLQVCSIASGSNGNCYYVGNEEDAVLVDAGISCRQIEQRMQQVGLSMERIRAIIVTHEHVDHVRGLGQMIKKYRFPIFLTQGTRNSSSLGIDPAYFHTLLPEIPLHIGHLEILPFLKYHDAAEPISVVIRQGDKQVGIFTDIGQVCEKVKKHFQACDIALLESNYDVDLLNQGRYPYFLKNRIRSGHGHLSNDQALALYESAHSPHLRLLLLTHLSGENNCPQKVQALFEQGRGPARIAVASRHSPSAVYQMQTNHLIHQQIRLTLSIRS
jgi:phosphoribosyl 1,2-cyclic phosphodiesterase